MSSNREIIELVAFQVTLELLCSHKTTIDLMRPYILTNMVKQHIEPDARHILLKKILIEINKDYLLTSLSTHPPLSQTLCVEPEVVEVDLVGVVNCKAMAIKKVIMVVVFILSVISMPQNC